MSAMQNWLQWARKMCSRFQSITDSERVVKFMDSHGMMTDELFLAECSLEENHESARNAALAVRRVIALLGYVRPCYIIPSMRFEDLGELPYWKKCGDAGFDSDILVKAMQENVDTRFTDEELRNIRDPDLHTSLLIREFIGDVLRVLATRQS